jgi:hypothetical protein
LPALQVTPATNIASSGNQGGPFSPSSFQYQLQATIGSVGYAILGVPSWLTASSISGTVAISATTITFTINSSANNLSPATYNATITFTDTTNNNTVQTTTAALTVNVLNAPTNYTLSVSVAGNGTVTSSPTGISCPSVCTMNYASSTPVMLTASPMGGATFNGWGGACTGNGSCLVTMNSIESVTAMFSAAAGGGPSSQTFVSASLGNDSNPCTRSSPCLTFAAALAQTTAGGEIDCLDPGGFGAVTITKAISIKCGPQSNGGVLLAGTPGITVAAPAGSIVYLQGLDFEGVGSGTNGVQVSSGGRVFIINCSIRDFTGNGVNVTSTTAGQRVVIRDSIIENNAGGVNVQGSGVGNVADVENTLIDGNSSFAVQAATGNTIALVNSILTGSPAGISNLGTASIASFGQSNIVTGTGSVTSTTNYK